MVAVLATRMCVLTVDEHTTNGGSQNENTPQWQGRSRALGRRLIILSLGQRQKKGLHGITPVKTRRTGRCLGLASASKHVLVARGSLRGPPRLSLLGPPRLSLRGRSRLALRRTSRLTLRGPCWGTRRSTSGRPALRRARCRGRPGGSARRFGALPRGSARGFSGLPRGSARGLGGLPRGRTCRSGPAPRRRWWCEVGQVVGGRLPGRPPRPLLADAGIGPVAPGVEHDDSGRHTRDRDSQQGNATEQHQDADQENGHGSQPAERVGPAEIRWCGHVVDVPVTHGRFARFPLRRWAGSG